ncbi:MAG: peptidoglycan-binding protein [Blastocatellia bacterium]|nr:peptidoglycan-binding protein [Blastocatellia bacterium]
MKIFKSILATFAVITMLYTGAFAQTKTTDNVTTDQKSVVAQKSTPVKTRAEFQPEVIEKAQQALKTKGLYKGQPNGKLDSETRDAVKSFQTQEGLRPTGRLNKDTRQKLGIEEVDKTVEKKTTRKKQPSPSEKES